MSDELPIQGTNTDTSSLLEQLPPELRYMIFTHLLTDPAEQKLQHSLTLVCKQTQAEFAHTIARVLGPKAQLHMRITNSSALFSLFYDYPRANQVRGHHDIPTGSDAGLIRFYTWDTFKASSTGKEILSFTRHVRVWLPYLQWTYDIVFQPGSTPKIDSTNNGTVGDARTNVAPEDARAMLEATAEKWRSNDAATSAAWADAFAKDLRKEWRALRDEAKKEMSRVEAVRIKAVMSGKIPP
ncbi:unnamed protein product [Aureobasidium uvarum]|uniref:F-box domain-containing protein n=1 Tax=Aureobasidium uvarum TaxID=2773716 RepID=A0A9N8PX93_9PEZI|nr:unnamed protein product [Aureobasidium uvarum]